MIRTIVLSCVIALAWGLPKFLTHSSDGRIIGGDDASIDDYPYQVSLQKNGKHFCGASILAEKWVVTAAHCTRGQSAEKLSIRAGSSRRDEGGVVVQVETVTQHPKYDYVIYDYDIAVLELAEELVFGEGVEAVGLPEGGAKIEVGAEVNLTGWGRKHLVGLNSEVLQVVVVEILTYADCPKSLTTQVTDRMLCAGRKLGGEDSCQGDSGGPLVSDGILWGITSWGIGCGLPLSPGVYSNVTNLRDFIKEHTGL